MMLKNIACTLFAVVLGMSWIILVNNKEIECYGVSVYIDEVHIYKADEIADQNLGCNPNHDDLKD